MASEAGERSRSSDSKRRALTEGKSVLISYLIFFANFGFIDFWIFGFLDLIKTKKLFLSIKIL